MWAALLPADGEQLFAWLLQLPEGDVLELVTFCLAASLNTQARRGNAHSGAALEAALGLNRDCPLGAFALHGGRHSGHKRA